MRIYIFAAGKCKRMGFRPKWLMPLDNSRSALDIILGQCDGLNLIPKIIQSWSRPPIYPDRQVMHGGYGIKFDYPMVSIRGIIEGGGRPFLLTCGDLIVSTALLEHFAYGLSGTVLGIDTSTNGSYKFFGKTLVGLMRIDPSLPIPRLLEIRNYYDIDTPEVLEQAKKFWKLTLNSPLRSCLGAV